jgi:hypothetical protein
MTEALYKISEARPGARLREVPLTHSSFPLTVSSVLFPAPVLLAPAIRLRQQTQKLSTMKTKFALCFLLSAFCFLAGCTTTAPTPQSIQSKAKGIAYLVTAESLLQHPEWKPHFEIASYELSTLATSTNVGLNEITAIVTQLPTKKLKGERVQIYLTVGALFLQDEVAELSLTQPEELRRAVQGASEGIDLALKLAK